MPGSRASSVMWRLTGAANTQKPGSPSPPRPPGPARPPAAAFILEAASSCAARTASFTAACTMSWSSSTSSGSTAPGSILISCSSSSPVILTVTMPPPAEASTVSCFSCSCAFSISACICCTWRIIAFMSGCFGISILVLENLFGAQLRAKTLDQLLLRQHHRVGRAAVPAQLVDDRERAPREATDGPLHQLSVALGLLLLEDGLLRERHGHAVALERGGARVGKQRADHRVLLAHRVGHPRPERLQTLEVGHRCRSGLLEPVLFRGHRPRGRGARAAAPGHRRR